MFDAIRIKNEIVEWIKNFFEQNGKDCNAVIGISGGTDSSVVAALCVEALGKDRVIGVLMPNGVQKDIDDAKHLVNHLGIKYHCINIEGAFDEIMTQLHCNTDIERITAQTTINLPPRIRMTILYAISQSVNGRVANTCNLSEDWVGYSTRYGDSVGDFSPLSNITKTEVKKIGRTLGLPNELVDKIPSDGLCGKTDEDNLGFTYDVLDRYIRTGEIDDLNVKEKIDNMREKNLFKLLPMSSFGESPLVYRREERRVYDCESEVLVPPPNFIQYNIGEGFKESIHIDKCLSKEIQELWKQGIKTTGCCCGHGMLLGYIGVLDESIEKMEELGYEHYIYPEQLGGIERKDAFIPKSYQHIYKRYSKKFMG